MPTESASAAAARDPSPPLRGASLRPLRSLRMTTRWLAYCQRWFDRERPSLGAKITDAPRVSGRKGPCDGPLAIFGGRLPSSCVLGRGPGLRANGGVGDFCTVRPRVRARTVRQAGARVRTGDVRGGSRASGPPGGPEPRPGRRAVIRSVCHGDNEGKRRRQVRAPDFMRGCVSGTDDSIDRRLPTWRHRGRSRRFPLQAKTIRANFKCAYRPSCTGGWPSRPPRSGFRLTGW